jgi:hypothetical protein
MAQGRQTSKPGEVLSGVLAQAGEKFFSFKHTFAGAADAILFATYGMPDMADADYRIMLQGEFTESQGDAICVDESTITPRGFSFVGGTAAEIAHIWIHGNVDE